MKATAKDSPCDSWAKFAMLSATGFKRLTSCESAVICCRASHSWMLRWAYCVTAEGTQRRHVETGPV